MAYKLTKAISKKMLANIIGISATTFRLWIKPHYKQLKKYGVGPSSKLLPPAAVAYLCDIWQVDVYPDDIK